MKVGLITYHSAYNFGSVLQAYATQEIIKKLAGNCEIINYRTKEQKRVYSIFVWSRGKAAAASMIRNTLVLLRYPSKRKRQEAYENFFCRYFNLSAECCEPEEVYKIWDQYDVIVSGSDQIWNKHSKELHFTSWNYMMPYLLQGYQGKKISYASSTANMSDEELSRIIPAINQFSSVSAREKETADKLGNMAKVEVSNVLDPTFLLGKEEWIKRFRLEKKTDQDFVLLYVLNKRRDIQETMKKAEAYARKTGLKVRMIAPLGFFRGNRYIEVLEETDPIQFLNLLYNAKTVITDSYHGTILSVNFEKDVYSICGKNVSDFRKTDILDRIGLHGRIITNLDDLLKNKYDSIDYTAVNQKLQQLKVSSIDYLKNALTTWE